MTTPSPLSREQLEALLEERTRTRGPKGLLGAWRHWRQTGERLRERWLYQRELPGLFQTLLLAYRQRELQPSAETEEQFLNARSDVRSHLLEQAWRPAFRRYWREEGMAVFTRLSRQAALRFPPAARPGSHLRLLPLIEGSAGEVGMVWTSGGEGALLRESVAAIPFERWIMGKDAPLRKGEQSPSAPAAPVAVASVATSPASTPEKQELDRKVALEEASARPFKPSSLADMLNHGPKPARKGSGSEPDRTPPPAGP